MLKWFIAGIVVMVVAANSHLLSAWCHEWKFESTVEVSTKCQYSPSAFG